MSAALASPVPRPQPTPRHVQIVTTRAQRAARPRSFYAVVTLGSVFALFLAQLMLSIALSDGAYQISALQVEQRQLARTEQSLAEQRDLLASPQSLSAKAEALGMVLAGDTPVFLRLSDGIVVGTATPAGAGMGPAGSLVPNALVDALRAASGTSTATPASGAPSSSSTSASVASDSGALPSPVTR